MSDRVVDRIESEYYVFMRFDLENARSVLSHYMRFFTAGFVVELVCGLGVFFDLLTEWGIECCGVDIDDGMIVQVRTRGYEVVLGEAVVYFVSFADNSVQGLFAVYFVEYLTSLEVQNIYHYAVRTLVLGGVFVAVVPNAVCFLVLTIDFWCDFIYVRFYDLFVLEFFVRQAGLRVVESGLNLSNAFGLSFYFLTLLIFEGSDFVVNVSNVVLKVWHDLSELERFGVGNKGADVVSEAVVGLAHFVVVLVHQQLELRHHFITIQVVYEQLLVELYPVNEVYVVAAKDGGTA